jgi:alcohol dehydrogenase YqhD (iron-dependent ADH family)
MARNVFGITGSDDMEAAKKGIEAVREFFASLEMPSTLAEVGITPEHFDHMAKQACKFGPIGVFKRLGVEQVKEIFERAK